MLPVSPAGVKGSDEVLHRLSVTGQPLDGAPAVVRGLRVRYTCLVTIIIIIIKEISTASIVHIEWNHSALFKTNTYTSTHAHTRTRTRTHAHTHTGPHLRTHVHTLTYILKNTHTHTYTLKHTLTYTHTHTDTDTDTHTHTHTHTHHSRTTETKTAVEKTDRLETV